MLTVTGFTVKCGTSTETFFITFFTDIGLYKVSSANLFNITMTEIATISYPPSEKRFEASVANGNTTGTEIVPEVRLLFD